MAVWSATFQRRWNSSQRVVRHTHRPFADGVCHSNDAVGLKAEIEKLNPDDVEGYRRFLEYSKGVFKEGYQKARLGGVSGFRFDDQGCACADEISGVAFGLFDRFVLCKETKNCARRCRFIRLLVGGNPMSTSAIYALNPHHRKRRRRVVCQGRHQPAGRSNGHAFRATGR